jgi:hypothetical protein
MSLFELFQKYCVFNFNEVIVLVGAAFCRPLLAFLPISQWNRLSYGFSSIQKTTIVVVSISRRSRLIRVMIKSL